MDSGEHCSLERFILLLSSGSPDLFTGWIRIKGYRSGHDATPRFVRACGSSSLFDGGPFAAARL
jgi:hypothetical protein